MRLPEALIFGAIGTLTQTSDLQRQAFNAAFAQQGLDWHWDAADYADMVAGHGSIVGGAARIVAYAQMRGQSIDAATAALVHSRKSKFFQDAMLSDGLMLNAGVDALLREARAAGVSTALASTTSRANIEAMLAAIAPDFVTRFDLVLSGADARAQKPAPDIYLTALERLNCTATSVIAIEDSAPSLAAALAASVATVVVPGRLWAGGDFAGARAVLPTLDGVTLSELTSMALV